MDELLESCDHCVVLLKFPNFSLSAVYFSQGKEQQILYDYISDKSIQKITPKGIIIGDFNTGKTYSDESKRCFVYINAFINLENIGLVNSWRSRNLEVMEFSWYSNVGSGFRIDHIFSTLELGRHIKHIGYDHNARLERETDYSAMFVEFED